MFDDNFGGGGFFSKAGGENGQDNTFSKAGGKSDSSKEGKNLIPVTTRQIRQGKESTVCVSNRDFNLLTLVGRVTAIETSSVKVTYTIQDDRGFIRATQWLEQDGDMDDVSVVENVICRVHGCVRTQGSKKVLIVFKIRPIESLNELTSHILEVALFPKKIEMYFKKTLDALGTVGTVAVSANVGGGGALGNSLMDLGYSKTAMSNHHRQVFQVIKKFEEPGVHVDNINNYLTEKLSSAQINKICEDLMNEGHIYSSIDEKHFLCTEN